MTDRKVWRAYVNGLITGALTVLLIAEFAWPLNDDGPVGIAAATALSIAIGLVMAWLSAKADDHLNA